MKPLIVSMSYYFAPKVRASEMVQIPYLSLISSSLFIAGHRIINTVRGYLLLNELSEIKSEM
jgi:hypothetical protein